MLVQGYSCFVLIQYLQLFALCLMTHWCPQITLHLLLPFFLFFSWKAGKLRKVRFQKTSKAGLTEIYGHVWRCFIGWWVIFQSRRWMESLWAKVPKSRVGGQRKALAGFCQRFVVNAAVGCAGGPQWGCCGGGVALTQQNIQEVITWTSLKAQGL